MQGFTCIPGFKVIPAGCAFHRYTFLQDAAFQG